jgi:hypothetical protein
VALVLGAALLEGEHRGERDLPVGGVGQLVSVQLAEAAIRGIARDF